MRKGGFALLLALMLFAGRAYAEDAVIAWSEGFGGTQHDQLYEVIAAGDGLFAVGMTSSSDGTLSMRTRDSQTGWAIRLDAEGGVLWNCCTAHVGRYQMMRPYAHGDGTFSCMLTAKDEGFEWLRISDEGKVTARVEVPEADALCVHGAQSSVITCIPGERSGEPMLAITLRHADGTYCCASMDEAGGVSTGMPFAYEGMDWVCVSVPDGSGSVAWLQTKDGCAELIRVIPGSTDAPEVTRVAFESDRVMWVLSAVADVDGSVIFSGQFEDGLGFAARVSAAGEILFRIGTDSAMWPLSLTQTGFAGCEADGIRFFDEDGNFLGEQAYPNETMSIEGIAALGNGVVLLENDELSRRTKQARLTAVQMPETIDLEAEYADALYARMDSQVLAARVDGAGLHLMIEGSDGERLGVVLDEEGEAREETSGLAAAPVGQMALSSGSLHWQEETGGSKVMRFNAQGQALWQTRTVIHTAADRLQWLCALEMTDGGLLLGGRYITKKDGAQTQQAVIAKLGADGVLREIETIDFVGSVCALTMSGGEPIALVSLSDRVSGEAHAIGWLEDVRQGEWQMLDAFIAQQGAWIFAQSGQVCIAGTAQYYGSVTAVVQQATLPLRMTGGGTLVFR